MTRTTAERKQTPPTTQATQPIRGSSAGSVRQAPKANRGATTMAESPEVPAEFSLRTLIREQLALHEPSPHVIAERVAKLVPEAELRVALALVLPDYVRKMDVEARPAGPGPGTRDAQSEGASAGRSANGSKPGRSKWDGIGAWYKRLLDRREYIDGEWKFFGDLSPDEVDAAALLRETTAERTAEEARKLRRVAELARERGAITVRALPAEVLAEVYA